MTAGARPPGPRSLREVPLADLRELRDSPLGFFVKVVQRYGDFVRYPLGPQVVYLVAGPECAKHILQDNNRNYSKDTFQYNLLRSVTGNGLLTSDGPLWLQQRRLAQPAFHRQRIAAFGQEMVDAAAEMVAGWQPAIAAGRPVDMAAEMMEVALRIVGRALFSIDLRHEAAELADAVLVVLDHVVYRARTLGAVPLALPTARNRRFRAALALLDAFIYRTIAARRAAPDASVTPPDLLAMFLAARDEETGAAMPERQLRDELITIIIAGHETVASALSWTWYLLAQNPDAAARLHDEVAEVLGDRLPAVADLPRLPYTRMVFDEALRLYPPAWIITRRALAADEIGPYVIPAGALVVLSPYVTQRLPALWDDPESFRPERFAGESGRPRFAYFPFGGGPRLCIGNTFALTEAQLILATVARAHRLTLAPGQVIAAEPSVTLRPKHGLWMHIH